MNLLPATLRALQTPLLPALARSSIETNRVYCCSAENLLSSMPSNFVDLIVTSPPYGTLRTYKGFTWDFEKIAKESYRVLKVGGVLVWVVGDQTIDGSETLIPFEQALKFRDVGFRVHDTMIYEKSGIPYPEQKRYLQLFEFMFVLSKQSPQKANILKEMIPPRNRKASHVRNADGSYSPMLYKMGGYARNLGNVWRLLTGFNQTTHDTIAFQHPAMFPEKLAERHILTWSNPGDLVLDFFGGSGTTAKMARNNRRDFITCDISREYCDLMEQRLAQPYTLPFPELMTGS